MPWLTLKGTTPLSLRISIDIHITIGVMIYILLVDMDLLC